MHAQRFFSHPVQPRRLHRYYEPLRHPIRPGQSLASYQLIPTTISAFFEACSAFTHVMACTLAESLNDPLHRKLRQLRCLRCRFDCYRVERTSSRAGVTPAEVQRLSRRTVSLTENKLLIRGAEALCNSSCCQLYSRNDGEGDFVGFGNRLWLWGRRDGSQSVGLDVFGPLWWRSLRMKDLACKRRQVFEKQGLRCKVFINQ